MQGAKFNLEYAQSIPALKSSVTAVQSDPAAVLSLLTNNIDYDFASAAWFLTTQCAPDVRQGLQNGGFVGFTAYVGCTGTSMSDDRSKYYTAAGKALGVSTT